MTAEDGFLPRRLAWLAAAQRDRCLYCGCETWLPHQRRLEPVLRQRWDLPAARSLACQLAFDYRMATVEHLRARSEGGGEATVNLAMACAYCNSTRQTASPPAHTSAMRTLRQRGEHPCEPGKVSAAPTDKEGGSRSSDPDDHA